MCSVIRDVNFVFSLQKSIIVLKKSTIVLKKIDFFSIIEFERRYATVYSVTCHAPRSMQAVIVLRYSHFTRLPTAAVLLASCSAVQCECCPPPQLSSEHRRQAGVATAAGLSNLYSLVST